MPVNGLQIATSVFLWITFALASVALFAPFWMTVETDGESQRSSGQLLWCLDPYDEDGNRDCKWHIPLDDGIATELEVSQYLSIAGAGIFLIAGVISFIGCCCESPKKFAGSLFVVGILGVGCLGGAMGTFVYYQEDKKESDSLFDRGETMYYDWALYVSFAAIASAITTTILAAVSMCRSPKGDYY